MIATTATVEKTFNQPCRYVIPVFQRYYSWSKPDWDKLWDDIDEIIDSPNATRKHFMGPLVFVPEQSIPGKLTAYRVIDGQQRLITLSILLCALRDKAKELGSDTLADEITEYYLIHKFKEGSERYRVYPRQRDRDDYTSTIAGSVAGEENIRNCYRFFFRKVSPNCTSADAVKVIFELVTTRLEFVHITLNDENPFQIFKSLNSTGVDLTEGDLIRNYVFMQVGESKQDDFDDNYWKPLEHHFEYKEAKLRGKLNGTEFSGFLRDVMMYKGDYVGVKSTFEEFSRVYPSGFDATHLVKSLTEQVEMYDVIRGVKPHPNNEPKLDQALMQLRQLESSTTFPLLLNLLNQLKKGAMPASDVTHAIRLISGFILRRYVCNESSRTYGKMFVLACSQIGSNPLENLREFLRSKGFPDDARFQTSFLEFDVYTGNYRLAILKELEMSIPYKERASMAQVQVEHIMPQTLTKEWRIALGNNPDGVHAKWKHTIGNLTLTQYNAELANKQFIEKRKTYIKSGYVITRNVASSLSWTEKQIVERGKALIEQAKSVWIGPDA